ncbi:hypothetical protein N7509_002144 [Penicillium cosmopolitanum]|uniref:F-box domain-containing protein n=1 Tax=Penicillium cosmopolitanum TaxID=1131564 RepID=A0A9W9W8A4_9EURO|nr:uncharacterized protein N7509_002144 [Penicillium cosmopolitanum]KAJ5408261.1 hypothetical protein N7509_002144 [Penicillium cosmopolitanum]
MAPHLPQEILCLIAEHLQELKASLVPCTRVCRQWQVGFEPLIYAEPINVFSADGVSKEGCGRAMPLSHFQKVTSGNGVARRGLIRHLSYHIVVPIDLADWQTRKQKGYNLENSVRQNNDIAFQSAIVDLFNTLTLWDPDSRLSLDLALLGREEGKEPRTTDFPIAGDYCYDYTKGRTRSVTVYRARFPDDGLSLLPAVACIDRLFFHYDYPCHQIWAGSAMEIARRCISLTEIILDLNEYIRPDHIEYIQARRQAVADGLLTMPHSLKIFNFRNQDESPWKEMMSGLNVLLSDNDFLSQNILNLSLSLRELKMRNLSLTPDFMFPLDTESHPLPTSRSLYWPSLEVVELTHVPPRLPSGEWVAHPTPEDQLRIDEVKDWEFIICDLEEGLIERPIFDREHFYRTLISLGHTARHMPCLRYMKYRLGHTTHFEFEFELDSSSGEAEWLLDSPFRPDQRVADVWKFPLEDEDVKLPPMSITIADWSQYMAGSQGNAKE